MESKLPLPRASSGGRAKFPTNGARPHGGEMKSHLLKPQFGRRPSIQRRQSSGNVNGDASTPPRIAEKNGDQKAHSNENTAAVAMVMTPPRLELRELSEDEILQSNGVINGHIADKEGTRTANTTIPYPRSQGVNAINATSRRSTRSSIPFTTRASSLVRMRSYSGPLLTPPSATRLNGESSNPKALGQNKQQRELWRPVRAGQYEQKNRPSIVTSEEDADRTDATELNDTDDTEEESPPSTETKCRIPFLGDGGVELKKANAIDVSNVAVQDLYSNNLYHETPTLDSNDNADKSHSRLHSTAALKGVRVVRPPKTPTGNSTYEPFDVHDSLSASQRVRMELCSYAGHSQNDDLNGQMPSPSPPFRASGKDQFSTTKSRQLRGNDLITSKLLPTRESINNLLDLVHELKQSETSLREQLARTQQRTEDELAQALVQVNYLELLVQKTQQERELAEMKCEEQDQIIFALSVRLNDIKATIGNYSYLEGEQARYQKELKELTPKAILPCKLSAVFNFAIDTTVNTEPASSVNEYTCTQERNEESIDRDQYISSPKPLWSPWSSGSDSPMTRTPPMFTIAPSDSDLLPPSSSLSESKSPRKQYQQREHELRSVIQSPRRGSTQRNVGIDDEQRTSNIHTTSSKQLSLQSSPITKDYSLAAADRIVIDAWSQRNREASKEISENRKQQVLTQPASSDSRNPNVIPSTDESLLRVPKLSAQCKVGSKFSSAALEQMLIEFFTEFDNCKLKMAGVYGKRYIGREERLFTELSRRYGEEKVAGLRKHFASANMELNNDALLCEQNQAPQISDLLPDHRRVTTSKQSERTTPEMETTQESFKMTDVNNADNSCATMADGDTYQKDSSMVNNPLDTVLNNIPPPKNRYSLHPISENEEVQHDDILHYKNYDSSHQVYPIPTMAHPECQDASEESQPRELVSSPNSDNQCSPYDGKRGIESLQDRMTQHFLDSDGSSKASPIIREGELSSNIQVASMLEATKAETLSLRSSSTDSTKKLSPVISPTLESLLKELYRKHQPNKLRNAAAIAKEYSGNERELIRILKGKYGALSVKRLEEYLDLLERCAPSKDSCMTNSHLKKNGYFKYVVNTMLQILFVVMIIIITSLVAVVLLDSQECHLRDVHDIDGTMCLKLKHELAAFKSTEMGTYFQQVHPLECFCMEWESREAHLIKKRSIADMLNLAKMVPFSRVVISPWIYPMDNFILGHPNSEGLAFTSLETTGQDGRALQANLSSLEVPESVDLRSGDEFSTASKHIDDKKPLHEQENIQPHDHEAEEILMGALTKVALASKSLATNHFEVQTREVDIAQDEHDNHDGDKGSERSVKPEKRCEDGSCSETDAVANQIQAGGTDPFPMELTSRSEQNEILQDVPDTKVFPPEQHSDHIADITDDDAYAEVVNTKDEILIPLEDEKSTETIDAFDNRVHQSAVEHHVERPDASIHVLTHESPHSEISESAIKKSDISSNEPRATVNSAEHMVYSIDEDKETDDSIAINGSPAHAQVMTNYDTEGHESDQVSGFDLRINSNSEPVHREEIPVSSEDDSSTALGSTPIKEHATDEDKTPYLENGLDDRFNQIQRLIEPANNMALAECFPATAIKPHETDGPVHEDDDIDTRMFGDEPYDLLEMALDAAVQLHNLDS